jgi:hypothetical protein
MTSIGHVRGIWSISGAFWLLFSLYISIRIMQFIVNGLVYLIFHSIWPEAFS